LLDLVHGMSAEEQQQIMGAQGGGEKFLEFTRELNSPDYSVKQYVNDVKELRWMIYTRMLENVRGTPAQEQWETLGEKWKKDRPYAEGAKASGDFMEQMPPASAENKGRSISQYDESGKKTGKKWVSDGTKWVLQ
jgi:hypothetical protein